MPTTIMPGLLDSERVTQAFIFLLIVSIAYYVFATVKSYRKLRHIPGPFLAAVSQLWLLKTTAGGDFYITAEKVLRKYGMYLKPSRSSRPKLNKRHRFSCPNCAQHDHSC